MSIQMNDQQYKYNQTMELHKIQQCLGAIYLNVHVKYTKICLTFTDTKIKPIPSQK